MPNHQTVHSLKTRPHRKINFKGQTVIHNMVREEAIVAFESKLIRKF